MSKEYKVRASSMSATYNAGRFIADSAEDAIEQAKSDYRKSSMGRMMNDVGAFRFYIVDKFPYEDED